MIKAIIFDFGGVLIQSGQLEVLSKDFGKKINKDPKYIYDTIKKHWEIAKIGTISNSLFWQYVAEEIGCDEMELKEYITGYNKQQINRDVLEYIKTLRGKYILAILSNHVNHDFDEELKEYNPKDLFDYVITSANIQMKKPNLEIYIKTAKILNVDPENCIFVDDMENNIIAAEEIGMKGVLFTTLEEVKKKIEELL
ncbi:MAG: HAD family phosphatase [Nanoarchaeota archaeon]|nr:HAD family phosphatase [Nanoarchaeota archaeon]